MDHLAPQKKYQFWPHGLIGLTALIGTFLDIHFKIPYGFLIVVTSLVLLQLFSHELYEKSLERVIGPAVMALFSAGLMYFCGDIWELTVVVTVGVMWAGFYLYARKWHGYSMILGGVTSGLILVIYYSLGPSSAYQLSLYWPLNIVIGVLITWVSLWGIRALTGFSLKASEKLSAPVKLWAPFDRVAAMMALRILVAIGAILLVSYFTHQFSASIQALIAGTVVSAQFDLALSHQRLFFRVLGVIFGAGVALAVGYLAYYFHSPYLNLLLIPLMLMVFSFAASKTPSYLGYFFLQAGIMVPLILLDVVPGETYDTAIGISRTLGSIEGGVIGLLAFYLFYFPIRYVRKIQENS